MKRMSPESIKIFNGTKWSERGLIPSFKDNDKISYENLSKIRNGAKIIDFHVANMRRSLIGVLMEAFRRTYKILQPK
jgi:hypothetical protein